MVKSIRLGNIPIHLFTIELLHETIESCIELQEKSVFLHANARLIELANTSEKWLVEFYNNELTYVMCDGAGIQVGARMTGQPIPVKIPYNIWMWDLAKFLADKNYSIFFLGSTKETLERALENLRQHAPSLRIVGHHHGYFCKDFNSEDNASVINHINNVQPDVLIVGFGMPIQEKWIMENYNQINAKAAFTCGGAFDFISGDKKVAPYLLRKLYLEWLFRFTLEPVRLFSRATISLLKYITIVLKTASKPHKDQESTPRLSR